MTKTFHGRGFANTMILKATSAAVENATPAVIKGGVQTEKADDRTIEAEAVKTGIVDNNATASSVRLFAGDGRRAERQHDRRAERRRNGD